MVSLVYNQRVIPVYFTLLDKKGSSNLLGQKQVLKPSINLFIEYKIIVLGDREFCSVDLAKWLSLEKEVYLSLLLKKSEYAQLETDIWFRLSELGLSPGFSVYYRGIKVTKMKEFSGINLTASGKKTMVINLVKSHGLFSQI
ncbi:mobile element protein [Geminocystis sp. NIES-3708]|uniref:hypothetical protein n=1 Tax=Geminocystis sp. NIES-3708 TaxID=1615909 RepID=UPI0005FC82DC|nr:hypothetical protein [Geminocystis sp. NIES-3708]BAQ62520.1 mobile element protein [Geminocystis sp. NIES-3708]